MSLAYKTYRYELRPDRDQRIALLRMAGARRYVFNWALGRWKHHYTQTGTRPRRRQLYAELTALKREPGQEWLAELNAQVLQQAVLDLERAFDQFFRGHARYPRFKSKKRDAPRFRVPQRVHVDGDAVHVPRIGWIRMRLSRTLVGEIRSATFKLDASGRWNVFILVRDEVPDETPLGNPERLVGIDLGLIDFVVLSDGTRVPAPGFARRDARRLRRARQRLSRKQLRSRNRGRERRRLARLYASQAARRKDFLHKLSTRLVRGYDGVCLETLDARGLARTKLSRSVADSAFGEFKEQLVYKARWAGKPAVQVGRFFPSSKRCANCGEVNKDLDRSARSWLCICGSENDRDLNAALNIQQEGLRLLVAAGHADTQNACGVQVRPPTEAQDGEAGIPSRECQTGSIPVIRRPR